MAWYRYASAKEVVVIQAKLPWRVPNVDRHGRAKLVYFTSDYYDRVSAAETALQIGSKNPHGATPPPSERLDLDLTGISYTYHGIVPGSTGTEYTTPDSPLVTAINPLKP